MKNAVEGLVLLANNAMARIREEVEKLYFLPTRVTGPIEDILISLKGLQDLVKNDARMYEYLATFILTVMDKKWKIYNGTLDMLVVDLMSDWGSIYEAIETDCLRSLGYSTE